MLNLPSSYTDRILQTARIAHVQTREPVLLASSPTARYNSPVPPVSQTIRVTVLFFGRLKELAGHAEHSVEFAEPLLGCRFAQPGIRRLGYASPFRRRSRVSPARERRLTHQYGATPSR